MRNLLRRSGAALAAGAFLIWCSCERHHVGELPTEESETNASAGKATSLSGEEQNARHATTPSGSPAATATPADFFKKNP